MLCWLVVLVPIVGVLSFSPLSSVSSRTPSSVATSPLWLLFDDKASETTDGDSLSLLSEELVRSLDLDLVLDQVAAHTGTRRGRQAFMAIVGQQDADDDEKEAVKNQFRGSKQQRCSGGLYNQQVASTSRQQRRRREQIQLDIATCAVQAQEAYELTEQATRILQDSRLNKNNTTMCTLLPPLYGADSSPWDTQAVALTDYDYWIQFETADDWTLEHVAQAEQVIGTLLRLYEWAQSDATRKLAPSLANQILVGWGDGTESAIQKLQSVHAEIENSVQLVRVRSLTDPRGRGTFSFQLNENKYRILEILREKQRELQEKVEQNPRGEDQRLVAALAEEIQVKESEIKLGLVLAISRQLDLIDKGLVVMARIDTIFAKAAFGIEFNGQIPLVQTCGCISVDKFVHPLLTLQNTTANRDSVPIALKLNTGQGGKHALIISGPNGGGKTLALKSFGLVAVFSMLGIPIPVYQPPTAPAQASSRPRVDLFDRILVSIGDGQDLVHGESTFTAQVNRYSNIIHQVAQRRGDLVLLDELGSGTDINEGGMIAQAVLEKLLVTESCRVVATTHSARIKALAFENDDYECAAVLLKPNESGSRYQLPSYQLQYGCIGESYAFGAAARSNPPLPEDVMLRAWELLESCRQAGEEEERRTYNQALAQSLQRQLDLATEYRAAADRHARDMGHVRRAMLALASAYDHHLARLETRVEQCYHDMSNAENSDSLEILGDTLAELRTVKKEVKSEKELLRERGLRPISDDAVLAEGESVVIIARGELEGTAAEVVSFDPTQQNVAVIPSFGSWNNGLQEKPPQPIVLKRYDLAVWDYGSVWDDTESEEQMWNANSINESKRRLNSILSTIKSQESRRPAEKVRPVDGSGGNPFKSARQRKASRKSKRKRK